MNSNIEENKIILDFLVDWLDWTESAELDHRFSPGDGLCFALMSYYNFNNITGPWITYDNALKTLFKNDQLSKHYPFGKVNFYKCQYNNTQYLDPARLAWVKKTINHLQK